MITASAPGKALLSGEYAVLDTGPALVTAIDRRARVTICKTKKNFNILSAPGYLRGEWKFTVGENGTFNWLNPAPPSATFSLVEEVWRALRSAHGGMEINTGLSIQINSAALFDSSSGSKLGIGSSAAVAVALSAALCKCTSGVSDVRKVASAAHSNYQGSFGSGVDIAASYYGGLTEYRRSASTPRIHSWPTDLALQLLWSRQSSDTRVQLNKLRESCRRQFANEPMSSLVAAAEDVASAWLVGQAGEILDALRHYVVALKSFSVAHDLDVFSAGHEDLLEVANECGVIYKPCGAGGGDVGVVFAMEVESLNEFCRRAQASGFEHLDVNPDADGVIVERE